MKVKVLRMDVKIICGQMNQTVVFMADFILLTLTSAFHGPVSLLCSDLLMSHMKSDLWGANPHTCYVPVSH